jgi:hypothetical protein
MGQINNQHQCFFISRHFHFLVVMFFFSFNNYAETTGRKVLLIVHDREITNEEFLYHFHQNYEEMTMENINEYVELFVDFHLKLACAREQRFHHQIGFINELAEYRLLLASPYLTDNEKVKELADEAMERFKYEIKTNHIFIKFPVDATPDDTLSTYNLAIQIRQQIKEAGSFEKVAASLSENDFVSVSMKSEYITALQTDYSFESVAYNMMCGEVSKPVKSPSGYYIIYLVEKRENLSGTKTEQEVISLMKETTDERAYLIEDAFIARLKKEWDFSENKELLEDIIELADDRIYAGTWTPPVGQTFKENLFYIDGKGISLNDFIDYMQNIDTQHRWMTYKSFLHHYYEQYVSKRLIQYENFKLPEKYPEFRYQYEGYRDAMLLLQVTKQQVWLKAASDSVGIKNFFEVNRMIYTSGSNVINLYDVFGNVQSDYQDMLMNQWVNELRSLYRVELNNKVLSSIQEKIDMN